MYYKRKSLKYLLFVLNFLCVILGIVLIWFGVWLLSSIEDVKIDLGENLAAILTIVLGIVVVLIAVFGCIAAYLESKDMLVGYAVIMIILLVIQLILVSISHTAAGGGLSQELKRGFDELWDKTEHNYNSTLSHYEQWLQCCGKNSAEDYLLLDRMPPTSCCKERNCTNILNLYIVGCEQKYKDYVKTRTRNFNTVSWFLIVIEFLCSILACFLVDILRTHRDRRRFYS